MTSSSVNTAAAREAANAHEEIALAPLATVTSHESKQCSPEFKTNEEEQDVSLPQPPITKIGLASLLALHLSSSWNARTCEFAFYLFLIELFPDTLLPASIYGFTSTGVAICFAGWTGGLVDRTPRLKMVRTFTLAQKASIIACSAVFLGLFLTLRRMDYKTAPASAWVAFSLITIFGSLLGLANIGTSVAVERDWITAISLHQDEATLTRLNTYMRRIDLLCKLLAPLWTSLLTTAASYTFAVAFLMGFAGLTLAFELWWIQVVFNRFPVLAETDKLVKQSDTVADPAAGPEVEDPPKQVTKKPKDRVLTLYRDWREFAQMPVFASSAAISLLYLTVLSFDGNMLAYLKSRQYSDAFLAGQRGICVVTGLAGTVLMPLLENKVGLIRAGAWSIVSEALTLVPVIVSFYVVAPASTRGPAWSEALLFGGMAASRIGLWAFDLCQLKELQLSLQNHPKRNRFMGLQFSLQNMADLVKYIVTIVLSQPRQFRWAALVSFISVCLGVCSYTIYVKKERGHVLHLDRIPLLRKYV